MTTEPVEHSVPAEDGNSQALATSSPSSELSIASRDPKTGEYVITTPIEGEFLRFRPGAKAIPQEAMPVLGPLGIKREWDPAFVLAFLLDAHKRGFDPYSKEIFLMQYRSRQGPTYVHHIGIAGMRRHAHETGQFGGVRPVRYCGDDGKWVEVWRYPDQVPYACKVTMIKRDWEEPIEKVGYYDEFAPMQDEWITDRSGADIKTGAKIPTPMWRSAKNHGKPTIMLAKCVTAMGFREGWSARFSSWYEPAEFDRARVETAALLVDERAERRQEAYTAATGSSVVDGAQVGAVLLDRDQAGDSMPADRVRAMLLAELDAQAAILGVPTSHMTAKWQATRGGRPFVGARLSEQAAHIRGCRSYVVTKLREQGRHEIADRYAAAVDIGTLMELFGTSMAGLLQSQDRAVAA